MTASGVVNGKSGEEECPGSSLAANGRPTPINFNQKCIFWKWNLDLKSIVALNSMIQNATKPMGHQFFNGDAWQDWNGPMM